MKYENYRSKVNFIKKYINAKNASTGSEVDSNANVEFKNITTLMGEVPKKDLIGVNRLLMHDMITELFGKELADEYIRQLESHEIYKHDETNLAPYCVSISMYPFLFYGLSKIGGISDKPNNLKSFCGSFINLVFAISSQFAGAVATPEFLCYFDYFLRKDFGNNYINHLDRIVSLEGNDLDDIDWDNPKSGRTLDKVICDYFEQLTYSLNQPASARNYQSVFWNIAYFDKDYFNGIFGDFVFPDGTEPCWETTSWLQKRYMKWFNKERTRKLLTFPVETMNLLNDGEKALDEEYADFATEMWSEGHSFFLYTSNSVDSLASCCRLRNEINDNTFSYTLGAGGVATGSKGVITFNINRLIQNATKNNVPIEKAVEEQIDKIHKYLIAYNEIIKNYFKGGLLPIYDAGFISLEKQFLTVGINGFTEGAEFLGIDISDNEEYREYNRKILKTIYDSNRKAKTDEIMFNTEFVPAENLGVKNAKWDKEDGYFVPRDCYNSYFYRVEDENCTVLDKFTLHGNKYTQYLDGGSALHCNLEEHLTQDQYKVLLNNAIKEGCSYFTYNIPNTICNDCGHIDKRYLKECPHCGSHNLDYGTRVIGYLKRLSSFAVARLEEALKRFYAKF